MTYHHYENAYVLSQIWVYNTSRSVLQKVLILMAVLTWGTSKWYFSHVKLLPAVVSLVTWLLLILLNNRLLRISLNQIRSNFCDRSYQYYLLGFSWNCIAHHHVRISPLPLFNCAHNPVKLNQLNAESGNGHCIRSTVLASWFNHWLHMFYMLMQCLYSYSFWIQ